MGTIPLYVGTDLETGEAVSLEGSRFNRHTFWCGQSGSGKTYALGVVLEQLLLASGLPILIFDPNSDFIHLGEPESSAPPDVADRIRALDTRVFRAKGRGGHDLVVRIADMELASRAAALRLDPIHDDEEYAVLRELHDEFGPQDGPELLRALANSELPARKRLLRRMVNLGIPEWDVWARGNKGVEEVIEGRPDLTVADIGGFRHPDEGLAAALAILDRLWAGREGRNPILIVIDEAHNLCPALPRTPLEVAVTERLIQIAAEGRKFGLWLLLSTQRPSKIHPQVLSQCDNLALLRTNAPADLAQLAEFFGSVSPRTVGNVATGRVGPSPFRWRLRLAIGSRADGDPTDPPRRIGRPGSRLPKLTGHSALDTLVATRAF